jgi:phosphoglycerate kinase
MLSKKATLADLPGDLTGKRVLVRVDFNVPMKNGEITDDNRIKATLPTLRAILAKNPSAVILMSHLGRPDGVVKPEYSLRAVGDRLASLLKDCVSFVASYEEALSCSGVVLLENLRFHGEEEGVSIIEGKKVKLDKALIADFCNKLTSLGDIFVNDAFGTAHRAHASMVGITLPIRVAGLLMEKEIASFSAVLEHPVSPRLAILGGAKVQDKIQLIEHLIDSFADAIIIGGGMAFTFLKVIHNMEIGDSLFDAEGAKTAVAAIMTKAKEKNVNIHLPVDWIVANKFSNDAETKLEAERIEKGWMGLDIGPESVKLFAKVIDQANTIVWNGPMGVFEFDKFASGSQGVLDAVIKATQQRKATTIVGGGDTAAFVEATGNAQRVTHVSTGGGASLELLEGKILPGVNALSNKTDLNL